MPAPALSIIRAYTHARTHAREMLILCMFCAIFAQNGPNSRQNRPKTAEFAGKMRFFVRKVRKSLAIVRKSRYNVPVTTKERVTQNRTSNINPSMNQTDNIDINRLLDSYAISLVPGDMVKLTADKKTAAMICPIIKANKPAIVAELKRREAERKAIKARRDAAYSELREGIVAIRNAQNALRNDREHFARCMEQGVSKFKASEPVDLDAIKAKFPAAAAYCKADDMSMKSNYIYSGAGKRAKERMLDGMDWKQALDLMEQETKTELD